MKATTLATGAAMISADTLIIIYTTVANAEDAREIARMLVDRRLAACVNILPGMTSIYRWEGTVEDAGETAVLIKTRQAMQSEVLAAIAQNHPYSVPALMVFTPQSVSRPYLDWALAQTLSDEAAIGIENVS